jgi:hypothetical protein
MISKFIKVFADSSSVVHAQLAPMIWHLPRLAAAGTKGQLPVKWLPNTTRNELYAQYTHWHLTACEGEAASLSTFRSVWITNWRGTIGNVYW